MKAATYWRNSFNPFEVKSEEKFEKKTAMTFQDLWNNYEESYFPTLESSSQIVKRFRIMSFFKEIKDLDVNDITPEFLEYLLRKKKKEVKSDITSRRCNFNKPLKELKAIFNWYIENYNYKFRNPVLKRHYVQGVIRAIQKKEKVLKQEQLLKFFKAFDNSLYQDFAIIQFFCAARFGEIAGMQLKNIDLKNKSLLIKEVVVEDHSKRFLELKLYPKNGHPRAVAITSEIFFNALFRRLALSTDGCSYLFHKEQKPLSYRSVQYHYNKALAKAGLFPQFSSTHILRYSMATESRRVMGSLDAAQAITGHHSIKMIEQYARLPDKLQNETISRVGQELQKSWDGVELARTVGTSWDGKVDF